MHARLSPVIVLLILACVIVPAQVLPAGAQYAQVDILAQWPSRTEQTDFQALLLPLFQQSNIQPNVISAANLQQTLDQLIEAETPPDIVIMSQPGLIAPYAATDRLRDLGAVLGDPPAGYPDALRAATSIGGTEYGRYIRLEANGLVWFSPARLSAAGYEAPAAWDGVLALAEALGADGRTPWSLSMSSGDGAAQLVEALLVAGPGAELLDGLASGTVAWTDPRVAETWTQLAAMMDTGVIANAADLSAVDAALAPFAAEPEAYLAPGTSTALRWITNAQRRLRPGSDIAFVLVMAPDAATVLATGDFIVLLNDDEMTVAMARLLADPATAEKWAAKNSALSPYPGADYPNELMAAAAALVHESGPVLALADRLDPAVRSAYLDGLRRYLAGEADLEAILSEIEAEAGPTR